MRFSLSDVAFLGWSLGFVVTGIERRVRRVLGRLSPIELQPQSTSRVLFFEIRSH